MSTKIIALITLLCFLLFEWSCTSYSVSTEKAEILSQQKDEEVTIVSILKKSGELVQVPEKTKCSVQNDTLFIGPRGVRRLTVDKRLIKKGEAVMGQTTRLVMENGESYTVLRVIAEGTQTMTFETLGSSTSFVPLSEVDQATVKRVSAGKTFIYTLGGCAVAVVVLAGIIAATKESCPFIYSYDGKTYTFDAEPYGGATCEGLKRTEWCRLENLKSVKGHYKLKLTNEVEETQYTDELKLVVTDHAKGTRVVPDESGRMHTFLRPATPKQTSDERGKNLRFYLDKNDRIFWLSSEEDALVGKSEKTKNELTFTFSKPAGATQAKILFNGCNTLWASQMVKRYLELHGNKINSCYAALNSRGAGYQMTQQWNRNEELYQLQIRVETPDGWKTKGFILGGGPFISEDKAYVIDISDVPGETLTIKLTPPKLFWMIDYMAVEYGGDLPVETSEISAGRAVDAKGSNILNALAATDSAYYDMPLAGDAADIEFPAPPDKPGLDRSVFAKVSGYYSIHLNAQGEPRRETLNAFMLSPGSSVRFALDEYQAWKKEIAEK
jgi:hypothetical protein